MRISGANIFYLFAVVWSLIIPQNAALPNNGTSIASNVTSSTTSIPSSTITAPPIPPSLDIAYRGSPQCTASILSYYSLFNRTAETDPANFGESTMIVPAGAVQTFTYSAANFWFRTSYTFTVTGPTSTVFHNVANMFQSDPFSPCCGLCKLPYLEVDIKYWPVTSSNTDCLKSVVPLTWGLNDLITDTRAAVNTGNIPISYHPLTARAEVPRQEGNFSLLVGDDGFTYTSPSVYLIFKTIDARNNCSFIGGKYTSITLSVLPEQLSTIALKGGYTRRFDFADIPCPPASVVEDHGFFKPTDAYKPFIAQLPQLTELDPAFRACWLRPFGLCDPPFAFTPQASLHITTDDFAGPTTEAQVLPTLTGVPTRTSSYGVVLETKRPIGPVVGDENGDELDDVPPWMAPPSSSLLVKIPSTDGSEPDHPTSHDVLSSDPTSDDPALEDPSRNHPVWQTLSPNGPFLEEPATGEQPPGESSPLRLSSNDPNDPYLPLTPVSEHGPLRTVMNGPKGPNANEEPTDGTNSDHLPLVDGPQGSNMKPSVQGGIFYSSAPSKKTSSMLAELFILSWLSLWVYS